MAIVTNTVQIPRFLLRICVALIVVLSLMTGYYHQARTLEAKKYRRLEDMYVRLRSQLGADKAQELIDQSYQK